jgi:hypothetical protein
MTTIAIAERFRVCQSFLGAKLHDAKDPGADLSLMLQQVVGSVFGLMQPYEAVWGAVSTSEDVRLFGFRYDVGLDPIYVVIERMLNAFGRGRQELSEIWSLALHPETHAALQRLGSTVSSPEAFHLADELWVSIIYEFACAYKNLPLARNHLLQSLTPLYLARVASFVLETRDLSAREVEDRIEQLCLCFEKWKPYLISRWTDEPDRAPDGQWAAALSEDPRKDETRRV